MGGTSDPSPSIWPGRLQLANPPLAVRAVRYCALSGHSSLLPVLALPLTTSTDRQAYFSAGVNNKLILVIYFFQLSVDPPLRCHTIVTQWTLRVEYSPFEATSPTIVLCLCLSRSHSNPPPVSSPSAEGSLPVFCRRRLPPYHSTSSLNEGLDSAIGIYQTDQERYLNCYGVRESYVLWPDLIASVSLD